MGLFVVCSLSNAMEKDTDGCNNTKNIVNTVESIGKKLIESGVSPLNLFIKIKVEKTTNDPPTGYKLVAISTTKKITGSKPKSNIDNRPKQGVGGGQSRINEKLVRLRSLGCETFVKNGIVDQVAVEQLIDAFAPRNIVDQIILVQLVEAGTSVNPKNVIPVIFLINKCKEKYLSKLLSDTTKNQKKQLKALSKKR